MRQPFGPLLVLAVAALSTFVAGCNCLHWKGLGDVPVQVQVDDAVSGRPVAGVAVSLTGTRGAERSAVTDDSGRASVTALVGAGGEQCGAYEEVWFSTQSIRLRLDKPGYAPVEERVSDSDEGIRRTSYFGRPRPPSLSRAVRMQPVRPE